jgi:hypothetical protein
MLSDREAADTYSTHARFLLRFATMNLVRLVCESGPEHMCGVDLGLDEAVDLATFGLALCKTAAVNDRFPGFAAAVLAEVIGAQFALSHTPGPNTEDDLKRAITTRLPADQQSFVIGLAQLRFAADYMERLVVTGRADDAASLAEYIETSEWFSQINTARLNSSLHERHVRLNERLRQYRLADLRQIDDLFN